MLGDDQQNNAAIVPQAEWLRVRVEEADRVRPWAAAGEERRMLHLITRGPRYTAPQARYDIRYTHTLY